MPTKATKSAPPSRNRGTKAEVQHEFNVIKREADAALQEAKRQAAAHYEQQILILQKDGEAERKVAELQVKTLQETQAQQIASLDVALEETKRQVQEIALKAIEGASGSRALAHVNQIAMEQAKGRPQG